MPLTLAIESTGRSSAVALLQGTDRLGLEPLHQGGLPMTQLIATAVKSLMDAQSIPINQIELVAVTQGPGSFTGLRVGITFAKTFAYATSAALKVIPTFEAIVHPMPAERNRVEVVEDLRKGQVAWQRFAFDDGKNRWSRETPLMAESFENWSNRDHENLYHAGLGLPRLQRHFPGHQLPEHWLLTPDADWSADAYCVGELGQLLLQELGPDDPFQVVPIYVRRSAAEERAESN